MNINRQFPVGHYSFSTRLLLNRMLSVLCGIDHEIGFILRSSHDPGVIVTGAEMSGIHTLLGLPHPGKGAYHLGGCGIRLNEAIIRTLGETIERYSQVISEVSGLSDCCFASYQQMISNNENVISLDKLNYFLSQQYYQQNFPFDLFTSEQPVTWIKLKSLLNRSQVWVPAQLIFVGYKVKRNKAEPWISSAVTTGTAAHTDRYQALINAIMEIIQIDSAMGHWYSSQTAQKIEFDHRIKPFENILKKYSNGKYDAYTFYWLKNPDLPGFSIACLYRGTDKSLPKVAIGLGSSLTLMDAMYKAFLEAVGVVGLSRMIIFEKGYHLSENVINSKAIYDLDSNVAYYGLGYQSDLINKKFSNTSSIKANELSPDICLNLSDSVTFLLESFSTQYKELLFYDLTGVEAVDLGFVVPRVWSPDLLPLCFPSAPFLNHSRYLAYGGAQHANPHPYP